MENFEYLYLASPYTHADAEVQKQRATMARFALAKLMSGGRTVYSPIVHGVAVNGALPIDCQRSHEFWMAQCIPLLHHAEAMVILDMEGTWDSRGVALEIAHCLKHDKRMYRMAPGYDDLERFWPHEAVKTLTDNGHGAMLAH